MTGSLSIPSEEASSVPKNFTWQQVAQHNKESSCWIIIDRKVYDVTDWLPQHPGGKEVLLVAAGRDCTDLFRSYHPFTDKPAQILAKFEIGTVSQLEFAQYRPDSGFYRELRQRVVEYFERTKQDPKAVFPGLWRLVLILAVAFASFSVAHSAKFSWFVRIVAAQIFGVCQALPLLHVMHDASHTAIGHSETSWKLFGRLTMDWFAGASMCSWHHQHVVGHHLYTNVLGIDPDLPVTREGDLRRVAPSQKWMFFYRFQHVYLAVLYSLLAIKFRIQDFIGVWTMMNGPIRINIAFMRELVYQVAVKIFWFSWRVLLPVFWLEVPLAHVLALGLISELVTGYYLTLNFQVSHISPALAFADAEDAKPGFQDEWAISQVKTAVDYAHNNPVATFFCGALNYQTVHHLFPCVSQYHYPALAPIVMQVCKKYEVRYNVVPTFFEALSLHFAHLKQMGTKAFH